MTKKQSLGLATLTIVTLIATFFTFAHIYQKNANRAACVINLTSFQKAWRSEEGVYGSANNTPMQWKFITEMYPTGRPVCPSGGTYQLYKGDSGWTDHNGKQRIRYYPPIGVQAVTCSCEDHQLTPAETQHW